MIASHVGSGALRAGLALVLSSPFAMAGGVPCVPDWRATFGGTDALNAEVRAAAVFDDGSGPALYVGGRFTSAGGVATARIARWDGTSWSALGSGMTGGVQTAVDALCVFDDGSGLALFAGGEFTSAGGVAASRVARWDGASWSALGSGLDAACHVLAAVDSGTGVALHAGGAFASAGGGAAGRLARWDGASWSAVGGTAVASGTVHALANWDEGGDALFVGGTFSSVGGVTASGIARWDGASWSALDSDLGTATVLALRVHSAPGGEALYVGGSFGNVANNVARWNGTTWDAYGSGMDSTVRALTVLDGVLYAGGDFTVANGTSVHRIALWNGSDWYPLGGGVGAGSVRALSAFDDGNGSILVAGGGFSASSAGDAFLAQWGCDPGGSDDFCSGSAFDCPCGNAGLPGRGCDVPQATGGVLLSVVAQTTGPNGATVTGTGFPAMSSPTAIVLRGELSPWRPEPFGDGLLCVGPNLVRLAATTAGAGSSTHTFGHGTFAGTYAYQIWFRSTPPSFCDPVAPFNLSNGVTLTW